MEIPDWSSCIANRVLVAVSLCLVLLVFQEIVRLAPLLLSCMGKVRSNSDMEHQLGSARNRNLCAIALVVPFCLLIDRFRVYPLWIALRPGWSFVGVLAVLSAYVLFRAFLYEIFYNPTIDSKEGRLSARRSLYSFFIVLVSIAVPSALAMSAFGASDSSICLVLRIETCLVILRFLVVSVRISSKYCSPFATILYLCVLELLPLGILVLGIVL